jgi:hypothetical protein
MGITAVTLGNLSRSDWRFAARGREGNDFTIDPSTRVSGFSSRGNNGSDPASKMLRGRQLAVKAFCDRNRRQTEHVLIAVVLPDDPGPVHGMDEVIGHLARETQFIHDLFSSQAVRAVSDGKQNRDRADGRLYPWL